MYPFVTGVLCLTGVFSFGLMAGQGKLLYAILSLVVAIPMFLETRRDYKLKEARWDAEHRLSGRNN